MDSPIDDFLAKMNAAIAAAQAVHDVLHTSKLHQKKMIFFYQLLGAARAIGAVESLFEIPESLVDHQSLSFRVRRTAKTNKPAKELLRFYFDPFDPAYPGRATWRIADLVRKASANPEWEFFWAGDAVYENVFSLGDVPHHEISTTLALTIKKGVNREWTDNVPKD